MYSAQAFFSSVRLFCTCHAKMNKYATREGRMIQKFLKGSLQKKKNWYAAEKQGSYFPVPSKTTFHQGSKVKKRTLVLNKLFMKNITDLMATGEVAGELLGRGISISKVKVSPDYKDVNVYWLAKGTEEDVTIQEVLDNAAYTLRHELSQLHVMGIVPKIKFVKDKYSGIITELDQLCRKADFGNDFEPTDPAVYLKSEFSLSGSHLPTLLDEVNNQTGEEDGEEPPPPMRMDVLGLDHALIMNKIGKSIKKSEALHRRLPNPADGENKTEPQLTTDNPSYEKMSITKFIQKRKIMTVKKRRQMKKYPENENWLAKQGGDASEEEWEDIEERDYIEEFEDNHRR